MVTKWQIYDLIVLPFKYISCFYLFLHFWKVIVLTSDWSTSLKLLLLTMNCELLYYYYLCGKSENTTKKECYLW